MCDDTLIVHCGIKPVLSDGQLSVEAVHGIHPSTSFLFKSTEDLLHVSRGSPGHVYRRYGNENTDDLALAMQQLERGKIAHCLSSGMSAVSSSLIAAGILSGNKRVLGPISCYGSTYSLLKSRFAGVADCRFFDLGNTDVAVEFVKVFRPDILYMETSSNPLTVVTNIALLAQVAKEVNTTAISIVDNTFATPLLVKPLTLGVDVVLHSLTKYLNGHGDVLGGAIVSNNQEYMDAVRNTIIDFGGTLSPWDAWLTMRGIRTLGVRMRTIGENALVIARYLAEHKTIAAVRYPGLLTHPQHENMLAILFRADHKEGVANAAEHDVAFSGMISFDLLADELSFEAAQLFIDSLQLISSQVSLGDVKTLASCPGLSTQHQVSVEDRRKTGIRSTTIRLSVGLEKVEDLIEDIEQSLKKVAALESSFSAVDLNC
jgi:methionine-gamma-lyase